MRSHVQSPCAYRDKKHEARNHTSHERQDMEPKEQSSGARFEAAVEQLFKFEDTKTEEEEKKAEEEKNK